MRVSQIGQNYRQTSRNSGGRATSLSWPLGPPSGSLQTGVLSSFWNAGFFFENCGCGHRMPGGTLSERRETRVPDTSEAHSNYLRSYRNSVASHCHCDRRAYIAMFCFRPIEDRFEHNIQRPDMLWTKLKSDSLRGASTMVLTLELANYTGGHGVLSDMVEV